MNAAQRPNEIERQALDKLLAGEHPALERLRRQLAAAKVVGRERTGAGFVTRLGVPDDVLRLGSAKAFQILDVYGEIDGVRAEASFILFVEDGALARLECQTLGDTWPASPRLERLFYMRPKTEGSAHLVEVPVRDLGWALAGVGASAGGGSGESLREMVMKTPRDTDLDLGATQDVAQAAARLRARAKAEEDEGRVVGEADATEPSAPGEAPGRPPAAASLSNRRTMALVVVNAVLATLLGTVLVAMLVTARDGPDAAPAAGAAPGEPLLQVLLTLAVAGGAGACLANLAALFRQSREPESLPVRQEVFYYLRPLVGALTALLAFLVVSTAVFAFTAGAGAGSWAAAPARTAYVATSLLAGLGTYEVLNRLRKILRALFPD
jgi:hypothetical protein